MGWPTKLGYKEKKAYMKKKTNKEIEKKIWINRVNPSN
jgi:hypothetical protein